MAEIQNHSQTGFFFIDSDDPGLHPYGSGDDVFKRFVVALENSFSVALHEAEKTRIADHTCFQALEESSSQCAVRKSLQQIDVGEDGERMMKAADEIFPRGEV